MSVLWQRCKSDGYKAGRRILARDDSHYIPANQNISTPGPKKIITGGHRSVSKSGTRDGEESGITIGQRKWRVFWGGQKTRTGVRRIPKENRDGTNGS